LWLLNLALHLAHQRLSLFPLLLLLCDSAAAVGNNNTASIATTNSGDGRLLIRQQLFLDELWIQIQKSIC
jgi:hypothetical protein